MQLENKRVLITGAARGLGKAMAQAFAKQGCRIVLADLDEVNLASALKEIQATSPGSVAFSCNVANEESVLKLYTKIESEVGGLDVAVLNAGILRDGLLIKTDRESGKIVKKMSLDQWQSVIDVNLTGVFLTGREAAAMMAVQKSGGLIINMASIAMQGNSGQTNYSAAKAGVGALTRLWAQELARHSIRVVGIAPGFIATEMVLAQMNQTARETWEKKIPIGRLGEPDEIAHTAIYIAKNDLVNGVVLEISGGVKI